MTVGGDVGRTAGWDVGMVAGVDVGRTVGGDAGMTVGGDVGRLFDTSDKLVTVLSICWRALLVQLEEVLDREAECEEGSPCCASSLRDSPSYIGTGSRLQTVCRYLLHLSPPR